MGLRWMTGGALLMAALGLSACTVNEADQRFDAGPGGQGGAGGGGEVIDDVCYDGCLKLDQCGQCAGDGECLTPEACATECRRAEDQATYLCLAETNGCGEAALSACFDGSAVDACQQACGRLDGCQTCLSDDAGECVDVYACAEACRAGTVPGAECLAALNTCDSDAINACFVEDDGAGDDSCADACRVLDGCGQCLLDEAGGCLPVAGCAEACRAEWPDEGACLNDLMMCEDEAIAACLESRVEDECTARCDFLDGCGYCIPDDNGECISPADCAAGCRAEMPTLYACLDGLEVCDEAPILACLAGEDPGPGPMGDACTLACAALDGCELCWPDDNGECMTPDTCAESCRAGDPDPATAGCLANVSSCDDGSLDACFEALTPVDCTAACTRLEVCGAAGEGGTMACLMACEAEWTPGDLACYAAAGEACEAVALCPGATPPDEPTACDLACAGLNSCDLLPAGDDAIATCLATCGGWMGDEAVCILEAENDCEAMAACQAPPVEPTACEQACGVINACGGLPPAEDALATCITGCAEWADDQAACLITAAEDCDAVQACQTPDPVDPCVAVCARRLECQAEPPADADAFNAECAMACAAETPEVQACVVEAADCMAALACGAP